MVQDARARMTPSGAGALVERSFAPLGPTRTDEPMLDLVGLIRILRRRLMLIVLTVAVVMALAGGYAFLTTPVYTASTKVPVHHLPALNRIVPALRQPWEPPQR